MYSFHPYSSHKRLTDITPDYIPSHPAKSQHQTSGVLKPSHPTKYDKPTRHHSTHTINITNSITIFDYVYHTGTSGPPSPMHIKISPTQKEKTSTSNLPIQPHQPITRDAKTKIDAQTGVQTGSWRCASRLRRMSMTRYKTTPQAVFV